MADRKSILSSAFLQAAHWILPAAAFSLAAPLCAPAFAQTSYAPYYSTSASGARAGVNAGGFHAPDMFGNAPVSSSLSGTDWGISAVADNTNGGNATASVLLTRPPVGQQTYISELYASAHLRFTFTIEGPDPDVSIPVFFNAAASGAVPEGAGYASMELGFYHDGETLYRYTQLQGAPNQPTGFELHEFVNLQPGHTYSIYMQANASAFENRLGPDGSVASASASVDPTFTILGDLAQLYHFTGLPDSAIGHASAVPEPASWAMMVGGFGLVGSAMRRRQRVCFA